jgi:uncharacterized protein (UPF0332 family)
MEKYLIHLSNYRIQRAEDDLDSAELFYTRDRYSISIDRSYYSIFHAAKALFALDQFDVRNHFGLKTYFGLLYVKPGLIETEFSKMLSAAFKLMKKSNYQDYFYATKEDAQEQLENAKKFLKRIKKFIDEIKKGIV